MLSRGLVGLESLNACGPLIGTPSWRSVGRRSYRTYIWKGPDACTEYMHAGDPLVAVLLVEHRHVAHLDVALHHRRPQSRLEGGPVDEVVEVFTHLLKGLRRLGDRRDLYMEGAGCMH